MLAVHQRMQWSWPYRAMEELSAGRAVGRAAARAGSYL